MTMIITDHRPCLESWCFGVGLRVDNVAIGLSLDSRCLRLGLLNLLLLPTLDSFDIKWYLQAGYDGRDGYNHLSLQYTDFLRSNADYPGRWVFRANRLPGIECTLWTSTVGAAVWGCACSGPWQCCIRWGPRRARGRGGFGGFVPHFHNGKCHWVADGEMFPIRMWKLDNIFVRQTYRSKARFESFFAIYSVSRSKLGAKTSAYAAKFPA